MKNCATGLSVRFFRVIIPIRTRACCSSTGRTLTSGRLGWTASQLPADFPSSAIPHDWPWRHSREDQARARVIFTGSGTQGTCNPINLWTTERSLEAELAFPSALSRGAETEFLDPALARGFSKAARAISISQSGLCYFPWRHRAEGLER